MATIFIDDTEYQVEEGQNLLQACLSLKLDLPYFCWHPSLGSVGACRQCAMTQYQDEDDTRGRMIVACMTPVTEGMRVSLSQAAETEFRQQIIETLMTNHPHDCPVCSEGGECHLQDMTVMAGHNQRAYKGQKRTFENQHLGPLIKHEMNRCITCYRCDRYYRDYAGGTDFSAQASRNKVYFGRQQDGVLESIFAGNLVEVCPTGVFTDKPFGDHYTRKWDLQSAPSVCQQCSVGCNTSIGERYGSMRRVVNRFNEEVNGYFLCDRGRFGFGYVNHPQRISSIQVQGESLGADWNYTPLQDNIIACKDLSFIGIGSHRASVESNFALKQLVGEENFCSGLDDAEHALLQRHMSILSQHSQANIQQIEQADAILILAEDITHTAPRIALAVRQALKNNAIEYAEKLRIPSWQDAAVRLLVPSNKVPLFIVGVGENEFTKNASEQRVMGTQDCIMAGSAIAHQLSPKAPKVSSDHKEFINSVTSALSAAKRPLIITGWSSKAPDMLNAAANIVHALDKETAMLCMVPPASNSLGLGSLCDPKTLSLQQAMVKLSEKAANGLLVLENDLELSATDRAVLLDSAESVIQLEHNSDFNNPHLTLPATTFSESEGTTVNYEGRIQSHYPVSQPQGQARNSWQWICELAKRWNNKSLSSVTTLTQLRKMLAQQLPVYECLALTHSQSKTARQSPRYSGRTAMIANTTVHEPKPVVETESDYSFSMEGLLPGKEPTTQMPYTWSPGWNSNQSVHKFQQKESANQPQTLSHFLNKDKRDKEWLAVSTDSPSDTIELVAKPSVFGSDRLSMLTPELAELNAPHFLTVHPDFARSRNLEECTHVYSAHQQAVYQLRISKWVADNCILAHCNTLTGLEDIVGANTQQIKEFDQQRKRQLETASDTKQQMLTDLKKQDQRIPINFVGGEFVDD